jgi:hypothetical protein
MDLEAAQPGPERHRPPPRLSGRTTYWIAAMLISWQLILESMRYTGAMDTPENRYVRFYPGICALAIVYMQCVFHSHKRYTEAREKGDFRRAVMSLTPFLCMFCICLGTVSLIEWYGDAQHRNRVSIGMAFLAFAVPLGGVSLI